MTARGLIALTGGTGFVGRYIVRALLENGWRVRMLARRPLTDMWSPDAVQVVNGDLSDAAALDTLLAGVDGLVHAAGLIKALHEKDFFSVNRDGAAAVAAAVQRAGGVTRLVVLSSLAARMPELSAYAASKRAGEEVFAGLPGVIILRPTAVYGAGDRETVRFFRAALQGILPVPAGTAKVTLIHAADVAAAVAAFCQMDAPRCGVYALTDDVPDGYLWPDLARVLGVYAGRRVHLLPVPEFVLSLAAFAGQCAARLTGRAAILSAGKVREMFCDWSCAEDTQPPPEVWRAEISLSAGLEQTFARLQA